MYKRVNHSKLTMRLLYTVLCLSFFSGLAQLREIPLKQVATKDGLSNFTVLAITEDQQGFIWFGTRDGLNRFDGEEVRVFKHDSQNSRSLGNNYINTLLTDEKEVLWVGTNDGLYRFDHKYEDFERIEFPNPSDDVPLQILAIHNFNDLLWLGTSQGIFFLNPSSLEVSRASNTEGLEGRAFIEVNENFYIGTNQGLFWLASSGLEKVMVNGLLGENQPTINALAEDRQGRLWIGLENDDTGLIVLDPGKKSYEILTSKGDQLPSNIVRSILPRSNGEIWVGTRDGLVLVSESDLKSFRVIHNKNDSQSISQNSIRAIYEGNGGIIWIGTYSGGAKIYDPGTEIISHFTGGYYNEQLENLRIIASIFEDSKGQFWIGTEGRGITIYNQDKKIIRTLQAGNGFRSIPHNKVKDFAEDERGRVFIGTNDGLSVFDPKNNQFFNISKKLTSRGYLLSSTVHDLTQDDHGNIWIGTVGNHEVFQMYDIKKDTIYHFTSGNRSFPGHYNLVVNTQVFDSLSGILWAGGDQGIAAIDTRSKRYLDHENFRVLAEKLRNVIIYDLLIDADRRLWIATIGSGMMLLDLQDFHLTTLDHPIMTGGSFYSLIFDEDQNIWASSNANLIKIYSQSSTELRVERFGVQDGLPAQQYYRKAVCRDHDGVLYFGGYNGFIGFDPSKLKNVVRYPEVIIKNLTIDGKPFMELDSDHGRALNISFREMINLSSDQSSFTVHFVAPSFINPGSTWYRYELIPSGQGWQDIGNSNVINFSRLKPGEYQLRIKASSDRESFGDGYKSLSINISPPIWRTPIAYVIYGVLILSLLYLFFHISRRWERLNQKLIYEHLAHEKEVMFNQQRAKFFTDISHELRTPLTLILAPLERMVSSNFGNARIKNQLLLMLRNGERMLQLINQLLDFRKLETGHMTLKVAEGDLGNFIREVTLAFREQAQLNDITFDVKVPGHEIRVFFDRDKFELILFNLLSNAMKYTPGGGKVEIGLGWSKEDNGKAILEVANSGKGIPPDQLEHIFERFYTGQQKNESHLSTGVGLEIVRELVKLHHGELMVDSTFDEKGVSGHTSFKVVLFAGKDHFKEDELLQDYRSSEDISQYEAAETSSFEPFESGEVDQEKILIVDDNPDIRRLVKSVFSEKYAVIEAADGEEALTLATNEIPDLIISDIMMPVMDGIELCKKIKSGVNTSHIPVILLTARTAVTFKYEGLETGADDYLIKPFSTHDLSLRAQNIIRQRNNLRSIYQKSSLLIPEDVTISSVDEKMLKKAVDYILENMEDGNLTVQAIAEEIGMSRVNFYRKIKALTSLSAAEFLRKIRMERAAQLLKTNKLNISEVRYKIGFSDADYFRTCFKDEYGLTPSEYQEKYGHQGPVSSVGLD